MKMLQGTLPVAGILLKQVKFNAYLVAILQQAGPSVALPAGLIELLEKTNDEILKDVEELVNFTSGQVHG